MVRGAVASRALAAVVEVVPMSMQAVHYGDVAVGIILFLLVWLAAAEFERSCGSVSQGSLRPGSSPGSEMAGLKALAKSLSFDEGHCR